MVPRRSSRLRMKASFMTVPAEVRNRIYFASSHATRAALCGVSSSVLQEVGPIHCADLDVQFEALPKLFCQRVSSLLLSIAVLVDADPVLLQHVYRDIVSVARIGRTSASAQPFPFPLETSPSLSEPSIPRDQESTPGVPSREVRRR